MMTMIIYYIKEILNLFNIMEKEFYIIKKIILYDLMGYLKRINFLKVYYIIKVDIKNMKENLIKINMMEMVYYISKSIIINFLRVVL